MLSVLVFSIGQFWVVILYLLGCLLCCKAGKGIALNVCGGGCE